MSLKLVQKLVFIVFLYSSLLFSQTYKFVIDSETNESISNVLIFSESVKIFSNNEGRFEIDLFSENDTIVFQHLKYETQKLSLSKLKFLNSVQLVKKSLQTEQVLITSQKETENGSISEIIKLNEFEKNTFSSATEIIKSKTSLLVRDYGGEASTKTISSRGMSSENTIVLFNEAKVNDLRTGTFDFSSFEAFAIDKIEYIKNNSIESNFSSGGTLKLYSGNNNNQNSIILGGMFNSLSTQKYFTSINFAKNGFSFGSNFSRSYSQNEFNFIFEGDEFVRKNANYSKTFANGDIKWSGNNLVLKFYTHYSHLLNGLPGFVVTNNTASSKASNLTNSILSIGNLDYSFSKNLLFSSTISFHNQYLKMKDATNQLLLDRDSQSSTFNDLSFSNKIVYNLKNIDLSVGYNYSFSNVDSLSTYISGIFSSNSGDRIDQNIYASTNYKTDGMYLGEFNFFGGLNYQIISDNIFEKSEHDYLSYRLGFSLIPQLFTNSEFVFSFSNNYRHPTFNEKYYSGFFGNSKLKGEEYKSFNAGMNLIFNVLGKEKLSLTYFFIEGNNRIIWAPTILAIQIPRNISKIKSDGIEVKFEQSLFNSLIEWELLYIYTNAQNKSAISVDDKTYNKQIIYTPKHRLNFNSQLNILDFRFSINSSFVGKRYFTPDNTERNSLAPYFILDLSLSYKFNISATENIISLNAYNILDEEYFIIQSYPMPLKTISINYSMRIQ